MSMVKHDRQQAQNGPAQSGNDTFLEQSQDFVAHHPMSASMTVFGVGLGVGLAMAYMIAGGRTADEGLTHRVGRQVLDKMAHAVPESWWKR